MATHGDINMIKHLQSTTGEEEEYSAGGQKESHRLMQAVKNSKVGAQNSRVPLECVLNMETSCRERCSVLRIQSMKAGRSLIFRWRALAKGKRNPQNCIA